MNKKIACLCAEDINIGFGYVISYLKQQGHDVRLFLDPRQYDRGYAQQGTLAKIFSQRGYILRNVKKYNPDMCIFSCVTATYQWALSLAEQIKKDVGCKIVFGGVHPTLMEEEVRTHKFIDDVACGDGIKYFGGKFDPDTLWSDREIFLDQLPPIHRKYQLFMTSFGCPFNCSYCGNEQLRSIGKFHYSKRTVEGCIRELKHLKTRGMKYVLFVDDILTANKKWFAKFSEAYQREIDLPYCCFAHPKFLTEDIVDCLKASGCHTVWIGIQTGDEPIRKKILNRQETNKEIIDSCALVKKSGIKLIVDHIFDIPSETAMSNDISYNLYSIIKPDIINCYNLLYFPKSKIIEHAVALGYLTPKQVADINVGKGDVYQLADPNKRFYSQYAKTFCALPIGGLIPEVLPTFLIKLIAYWKAGRFFIPICVLQNEIYFSIQSLWRKLF